MNRFRVGTRGSSLALTQTHWVCDQLRKARPALEIEEIIIKTKGDTAKNESFGGDWPVGAFVSALESALLDDRIDFAVHSHKDLQTAVTAGLVVTAIPVREAVHDVLLTRRHIKLDNIPPGFKVATSSPRRAEQMKRAAPVEIVPIRGNVPTRIAKLDSENLDGVVLAAAGLRRLSIRHPHEIALPTERFVPSPAQGALAIQAREGSPIQELLRELDHLPSRRAVEAERSFLAAINAGCHTPVGALAQVEGEHLTLHAQLFSDNGERCAEGRETGNDPIGVGTRLAKQLMQELTGQS